MSQVPNADDIRRLTFQLKVQVFDLEERAKEIAQDVAEKRASIRKMEQQLRSVPATIPLPPPPGTPVPGGSNEPPPAAPPPPNAGSDA